MRIGAQPVNSASIIAGLTGATGLPTVSLASASQLNWNGDTILARDGAANTLRQANGSSAQTLHFYNTRTDASNYERGVIRWIGNIFEIGSIQIAGTGIARDLRVGSGTTITFSPGSGTATLRRDGSSAATLFDISSTGLTSTALLLARLTAVINQASGSYTMLDISPTETAIGAGPHYFIRGRIAAGSNLWAVRNSGAMEMAEISDPAAPAANFGLLYMKDNGSGKTQLVARFPTGAVQVIATEP